MNSFIPYSRQQIDDDDIAAVIDALKSDYLTTGPLVEGFEAAVCEAVRASQAVAVSNGTAALHVAAMALDIGPGDVAIVPAITFSATANAVRYCGGEVIFADVDPDTGLMMPEHFEAALRKVGSRRLRAVFPVHLGGQCADPAALADIARREGIAVVEDACHSLGGGYLKADRMVPVGSGHDALMTVFSFHPAKTVTTGEGGAVVTPDPATGRRLRELRTHGITRDPAQFQQPDMAYDTDGAVNPWYYELRELGNNYRLTDIQSALGRSQISKLRQFVRRRAELVERYDRLLSPLSPRLTPIVRQPGQTPAWHLYIALIDFAGIGASRRQVMKALAARNIGTQVHYIPVPLLPYYKQRYGATAADFPGAQRYYERALSLPLYYGLGDADQDRVVEALFDILNAG